MFIFVLATSVTQYPDPIFIKNSKKVRGAGWQRTGVGEFFSANVK